MNSNLSEPLSDAWRCKWNNLMQTLMYGGRFDILHQLNSYFLHCIVLSSPMIVAFWSLVTSVIGSRKNDSKRWTPYAEWCAVGCWVKLFGNNLLRVICSLISLSFGFFGPRVIQGTVCPTGASHRGIQYCWLCSSCWFASILRENLPWNISTSLGHGGALCCDLANRWAIFKVYFCGFGEIYRLWWHVWNELEEAFQAIKTSLQDSLFHSVVSRLNFNLIPNW